MNGIFEYINIPMTVEDSNFRVWGFYSLRPDGYIKNLTVAKIAVEGEDINLIDTVKDVNKLRKHVEEAIDHLLPRRS